MRICLILIVIFSLFLVNPIRAEKQTNDKSFVRVIYFHGNYRCHTCLTIEKYVKEAVNFHFTDEIKSNKVKVEVINFDKKENQKYIDKYNLFNQALIMVKYKNGKEVSYKDCEKIWELVGDQRKFFEYVKEEVDKYLKGL